MEDPNTHTHYDDITEREARDYAWMTGPDAQRDRIAALEATQAQLVAALCETLAHVGELREAWECGAITEHDGLGGTRSNRNAVIQNKVLAALSQVQAPEVTG